MLRRKKKILDKIVHIKISEKIIYKKVWYFLRLRFYEALF